LELKDLTALVREREPGANLGQALDAMRVRSTWLLAVARVSISTLLLFTSTVLGMVPGYDAWAGYAPILGLYALGTLVLLAAHRWAPMRALAVGAGPFFDVAVAFGVHLRNVQVQTHPIEWALAISVFAVVISAFALRPWLVWSTAIFAFGCEVVVHRLGPRLLPAGIVLTLAAALAAWTASRIQEGVKRLVAGEEQGERAHALEEELLARLVHEEVQARLEKERSEELARANNHIAQVNAILKDQHRKLQLAQREAEKLTALLVHDMKGPLSSVLGFVELVAMQLGARVEAQGQVKHLKTALSQGRRLLDMIESLLAIARLERGAVSAKREDTELLPLLQAIVNGHAPRAQAQNVLLGAQAEPGLSAAFDRDLMHRLLENLVTNALSHTKDGDRIELAASVDKGELLLAVRNSGPPIPDDVKSNLFERFVTSAKPGKGNVGLGLYFCRLVAEAHQGSIKVVNEPGWSVSFVVRTPAGVAALDAPAPKPKPLPMPSLTLVKDESKTGTKS